MLHRKHLNAIKEAENQSIKIQQKVVTVKKGKENEKDSLGHHFESHYRSSIRNTGSTQCACHGSRLILHKRRIM